MRARTQGAGPLHIDTLQLDHGRVGLCSCPGRKDQQPRDLDEDLDAIRDQGFAAVVTLVEPHELDWLEVPGLGEAVEARSMDWYHVPVEDMNSPDVRGEALWHYTSLRLRRLLAADKGVLLHCMAGLGRTGTLASRLLVELGSLSGTAVEAVRAARPGTIEDSRQLAYVLGQQPGEPLGSEPTFEERVVGCLLGGALGDAFGYAVEFMRLDAIRERFGPEGLREPVYRKGRLVVSDDTQMTLFTAEGLLRDLSRRRDGTPEAHYVESVHRAYLRWLETQDGTPRLSDARGWLVDEEALRHQRAPGNTCLGALGSGVRGTLSDPINDSKGCGGVMRVAPVGLFETLHYQAAFELGQEVAAITHGHPSGYHSAGALAAIIRMLVEGRSLEQAVDQVLPLLRGQPGAEETCASIEAALELSQTTEPEPAIRQLGEGWVGEEALAIALYAVLGARSFREAVTLAANHDGDSDSTASIAGQLWGAAHGLSDLPQSWVRRLDVLDPLLALAHDLTAAFRPDQEWLREYP